MCVLRAGQEVDSGQLLAHLEPRVAKWWLPDGIEFVDSLPHGATGKVLKTTLREHFSDYRLPEPRQAH